MGFTKTHAGQRAEFAAVDSCANRPDCPLFSGIKLTTPSFAANPNSYGFGDSDRLLNVQHCAC